MSPNPTAAMLVIGDEILSGRTRDSNLFHLAGRLAAVGIDLVEARVVRDDREDIVAAVSALARACDHVFTSGGIGPTHDDITADCIAEAFGAPIDVREDARALLESHYARQRVEITPARLRMARIPQGARLIENPVSAAPGFTLGNVHVLAGVPAIFEAMLDGLLPHLAGGAPRHAVTLTIERGEGDVADALREIAAAFDDVSIGSYPFQRNGLHGTNVVLRGTDQARLESAAESLVRQFPDARR